MVDNVLEFKINLDSRLRLTALTSDRANHYLQDMRVMPAEAVAGVCNDARERIEKLQQLLESALNLAQLECPFVYGSKQYREFWVELKKHVAKIKEDSHDGK